MDQKMKGFGMPKPLEGIEKQTLFLILGHSKNNEKLCHGVENGVGEFSFLSGLLVAFGTLGQPLGLLWGSLGVPFGDLLAPFS
jgi:hypothetical protein